MGATPDTEMQPAASVERDSIERRDTTALRVLMLGPHLKVRGGVSAVENALIGALPPEIQVTQLATMVEGSKWRKLMTFVEAIVRTLLELRRRPDIVHVHFSSRASTVRKMLLARLALAHGPKLIMHAHGGWFREHWATLSAARRATIRQTLSRAHCLIVLGESWRDFFTSIGVSRERIVVLPNAVTLPAALPSRLQRPYVRLVYLGLFARSKGIYDLVDALTRLPPDSLARTRLVLAGNGEVAQVRELIERRGLARFVEVYDWLSPAERDRQLASADAFVLPSYAEGLPMALLEAMAWGLPVITTPVGSIAEHVRDGVQGILVRPGDVSELAGAIERIVRDDALRSRMGERARDAAEPLDVRLYGQKVAAIYRLIARHNEDALASELCKRS